MIYAAVAPRSNYVVESRVVGIERRQKPGAGGMRSNYVSRQPLGEFESHLPSCPQEYSNLAQV